jgi:hypothetical protein
LANPKGAISVSEIPKADVAAARMGMRLLSLAASTPAELRAPGPAPETAEAGALIAYGPRFTDLYRLRARIAIKILGGTKPADIPVEQPDRFELVINLQAAKAIGHEVPAGLVLRANKVIE